MRPLNTITRNKDVRDHVIIHVPEIGEGSVRFFLERSRTLGSDCHVAIQWLHSVLCHNYNTI